MNRLTLTGYLKIYFREIKKIGTDSMRHLAAMCSNDSDMIEYVALYAVLTGREKLCRDYEAVYSECVRIGEAEDIKKLSPKYKYIYEEYDRRSRRSFEAEFKKRMRKRIIEIQTDKKISNYRIYTDLSLNAGNVNDFLKNGDGRKLGINTVRRIWKYVERI